MKENPLDGVGVRKYTEDATSFLSHFLCLPDSIPLPRSALALNS